jgi:phosphoglucomutase
MNQTKTWSDIKADVRAELEAHFEAQVKDGKIDQRIYDKMTSEQGVVANLSRWMESPDIDRISPSARRGILAAIVDKRWDDVSEAFYDELAFGTGGIRGRTAITDWELEILRDQGIQAPILRGPNTINDVVLLQKSAGVAKFANSKGFKSLVIGYDTRIRGREFAASIAGLFIAYGIKVYMFDEPVPYPELCFAIPTLKADMGILLSASHNDRRYNGYKLTSGNGSQFSVNERRQLLEDFIFKTGFAEVKRTDLDDADPDQLVFLGGEDRLTGVEYYGFRGKPINMHREHFEHIRKFILDEDLLRSQADSMHLAFSAYHGAGRKVVPRLVESFGIEQLDIVAALQEADGMFPAFDDLKTPKGKKVYQQPDPGDHLAAEKAVTEYIEQYGKERLMDIDVMIGTDPDADRMAAVVPVPEERREIYDGRETILMDADTAWSILLWYRMEKLKAAGEDMSKYFLVQSHTTTDVMPLLAEKYGVGWIKTWVGFAQIAAAVQRVWEGEEISPDIYWTIYKSHGITDKSSYNFAALEQSNGFSILGAKPPDDHSMGTNGHVRDKDGVFAAVLFLEVLAYARKSGHSLLDLIDEKLYLDSGIGLIRTGYRPAPVYGQYEGLEGLSRKMSVIHKAEDLMAAADKGDKVTFGGIQASRCEVYKTGKYDKAHGYVEGFDPNDPSTFRFPDEGIRFFLGSDFNHLTIRPSGTSQSLRFHTQLRDTDVNADNLKAKRIEIEKRLDAIYDDIGKLMGVDWEE